ncbi:NUDIX domain-containing protein [Aquabacterium sp.]|uniref:NUDIX domain-containing protein n=1 Tax=Aquabacterium sp. TaxID=1872578 RepID=UPI0025BE7917|nr:NUDIX domain-containing protein [Aquabacterium sp.]
MAHTFCPQCAAPLIEQAHEGVPRATCPAPACGYVHWDNPVPVVAAIVEHEGQLILARNAAWPTPFYALITGFLEKHDPSPEEAVVREVKEELGLDADGPPCFVGLYPFPRKNQLLIVYHVRTQGTVTLNEELIDYQRISFDQATYWPAATGLALRDWLVSQGHSPREVDLPKV